MKRRTTSPENTQRLAAAVAEVARPGDLVVLVGGLGSGKTCFVQGFARALGVDEPVTSPTFALVHNYAARIPIVHADLYRLVSQHEVLDLGLDEALAEGAVALVEWGDIASDVLATERLTITISDVDDTTREFAFEGWADRWPT
ncbi:MAG TPA: tRNA (adenosine(37)-N6)-threonylcarbamoyltransferase complex ATPase subunit type 1 TsaE [Acidimicrobiales bacterium]|nr:tRNA (adenosine(37)-N6)-threonylcarbamoyltransferase complex ATPase subunit type 1 TsaE [Acidimicrobiales bacterium]